MGELGDKTYEADDGSNLGDKLYVTDGLDRYVSMTALDASGSQLPAQEYFYTQDRRSSVTTLTDATGILATTYEYSAMGEILVNPKVYGFSSDLNRYRYTGRELNSASNDYFFRYRTYSQATGSFFYRDPLGYIDGMSMYNGYFGQKLQVDPDGRIGLVLLCIGGAGLIYAGYKVYKFGKKAKNNMDNYQNGMDGAIDEGDAEAGVEAQQNAAQAAANLTAAGANVFDTTTAGAVPTSAADVVTSAILTGLGEIE